MLSTMWTCDKCGRTAENPWMPSSWAKVENADRFDTAHLCGKCTKALYKWIKEPRNE